MRIVAFVTEASAIRRILAHRGEPGVDYDRFRPHSSLGYRLPEESKAALRQAG